MIKVGRKSLKKNLYIKTKNNPDKELFFFDESRFGTHSNIGHGWFKKGQRSGVAVKLGFQNFYVYSAVSPNTGTDYTILLPYVNTDSMNLFLQQMSVELVDKKALLVLDCAGWHRSNDLIIPDNIEIIYLPPYSPELNPVERLWRYYKDNLIVNRVYNSLEDLEIAVCEFVKKISTEVLRSICSVNYLSS